MSVQSAKHNFNQVRGMGTDTQDEQKPSPELLDDEFDARKCMDCASSPNNARSFIEAEWHLIFIIRSGIDKK